MIDNVLFKLLNSSQGNAIKALLSPYQGQAAIFVGRVPEKAACPYVVINQLGGDGEFGCRDQKGAVVEVTIQIFDDRTLDERDTKNISEMIWNLIGRNSLEPWITAAGYENWGVIADYPQRLASEQGFPAYLVRVRASVLKV